MIEDLEQFETGKAPSKGQTKRAYLASLKGGDSARASRVEITLPKPPWEREKEE